MEIDQGVMEINLTQQKTNEEISHLLKQKDIMVIEAIQSIIGDDVSDEEWARRGLFTVNADGTEDFSIDGKPIIRFYPIEWVQEWDDELKTMRMRMKQRYEWLWDEK